MIEMQNVRKRFERVVALDNVNLSISTGERVAFVGSNGSGKTTLLRALLGLLRFIGTVKIGGREVAREPELALLDVAYIPQIAPPIEASVSELVRAHALLRGIDAGATYDCAKRLGLDVDGGSGARFRDLSGGMKQKLLAAMALATKAPILVCDEPTANLDGPARATFFEMIAERPTDDVVVLCSHRIEEVQRVVRRVVEFAEGRVVRDAPLVDLLRSLKAFRVEVEIRDGALATIAALRFRGFRPSGAGWFGADMAQDEKIEFLTKVMGEHRSAIIDLSVVPIEHISHAPSTKRPKLEVVAG